MKPRLNHLIHKSTVIVILIERFLLWNWSRILILTYSSLKSSILHVSWHFFMEFWISLMDSPVIFFTINMSVIRIYNFLVWIEYVSLTPSPHPLPTLKPLDKEIFVVFTRVMQFIVLMYLICVYMCVNTLLSEISPIIIRDQPQLSEFSPKRQKCFEPKNSEKKTKKCYEQF